MPRHGCLLLLLLACLIAATPAHARADACTISWASDQSGDWGTASNWSANRVPNGNDDVCIDRGAVTVTGSQFARSLTATRPLTIQSGLLQLEEASSTTTLTLGGGTLNANGVLTTSGTTTLAGANATGGNGSITNTGTFNAPAEATLGLKLRNEGTFRIGTGLLHLNQTLTNAATLELAGDGGITGPASFVQNGTLKKTAGAGTSEIGGGGCCFRIDGASPTFEVQSGALRIASPATYTGTTTLTGAITHTTGTLAVAGTLTASGGVRLVDVFVTNASDVLPSSLAGTLTASGATFQGSAQALQSTGTLMASSSHFGHRFANTGALTQQANASFSGDVTNTGTWALDGDHSLTQNGNGRFINNGVVRKTAGAGTSALDGRFDGTSPAFEGRLELKQQSSWTGGARLDGGVRIATSVSASGTITGSGAELTGQLSGGATLDLPLTSTGALSNVTNIGTLTLTGGDVNHLTVNNGIIRQQGDVRFSGDVTNTGTWDIDGERKLTQNGNGRFVNNGTIRHSTGTATLDGRFDGSHPTFDVKSGVLLLRDQSTWTNGAQINADPGASFRLKRDEECCWSTSASGTLTGGGGGRFEFVNGNLTGPTLDFPAGFMHSTGRLGHVTNAGELTLDGGQVEDGVKNTGTVRQTAPVSFNGNISNTGLWDLQGDHSLTQNANGQFRNDDGTIRKSAGAGAALLNGAFNSAHPRFDVKAGTLQLADQSTITQGAQIDAATGATFRIYRENECCWSTNVSGTLTGSGGGRFVIDNGTVFGGATLDFPAGYASARGGTLSNLENAGTLELAGAHVAHLFTNRGTVNQTTAGGYDGLITNSGTWNLESNLFSTANNAFVNTGAVRHTSGTALVTIAGNFDNRGVVEARSGIFGVQEAQQISNRRDLTGGTWIASGHGTLTFPGMFGIQTSAASITVDGPDASVPDLAELTRNSGTLTLANGAAAETAGLTNAGTISLGRSSRLTSRTFTNTGTLAVTIDGRPAGGAFGALSADTATLGGTLAVSTGPGFAAVAGDEYALVRAQRSGTFAQLDGLALSTGLAFDPVNDEDGFALRVAALGDTRSALRVTSVDVPATLAPGDDATIRYHVVNDGDPVTAGNWTDSLYLSRDGAYDLSDTLIGRAPGAGNAYDGALTAPVPGVVPGDYRVLVVPDSRGANPSLAAGAGARASEPRAIDLPALPASGTVAAGRTRYFKGAGPQVDQSGTARVLVRADGIPTLDAFDGEASPRYVGEGGYVAVVGPGTFNVTSGAVAFALSDSTPARGSGTTTLSITGAGFTDSTRVKLGGRDAARVLLASSRTLLATFDLSGVAPGAYALQVTDGARSATLPGAFSVDATPRPGKLVVTTQAPPTFRIGAGGFFSVIIRNAGGADVPMPLVRVTASKAVASAITDTERSTTSFFVARQPDVVPPGATVTVPIRFSDSGVSPHEFVHFKTELVAPDDTPVDWASRKAGLRPAGISRAAWEQIWPTFLALVGSTNKTYLTALRAAAARSPRAANAEADLLLALRERAIARAPGAPVRGTLTVAGQPAASKAITVYDAAGNGGSTRTDDGGAFALWDVPAGTYTVAVRGRAPWGDVTTPASVAINLAGATQIGGVLRDTRGKPVAGVAVEGRDTRTRRLYSAQTDKQGHFLLDEVEPGTVRVRIARAGAQDVTVPGAPELTFTLGKGGVIQGTVTKPDGTPFAGATVSAGAAHTTTDAAGNYILDSLEPGEYTVAARADGFGSVARGVSVTGAATADLRLDPEGRIEGSGAPTGAQVVLADPGAHHDPLFAGADGGFTLRGLSAGAHTLIVTADGYASDRRTVTLTAGETQPVAVSLSRAGTIRAASTVWLRGEAVPLTSGTTFTGLPAGRYVVALDPGLTVARQEVVLGPDADIALNVATAPLSGSTGSGRVPVSLLRGGEVVDTTVSAADGSFSFKTVGAGPFSVRAARADWGIASGAGGTLTPGRATLVVRTVAGARVTAGELSTTAGADGRASFPGLPNGDYAVTVRSGEQVARRTVTAPATVDIAPAPAASLTGTLRDGAGKAIAAANVLATDANGITALAVSNGAGHYELTSLPPGTYDVSYADGRHRASTRQLVLAAGATALDVTLDAVAVPVTLTTDGAARALLEVTSGARRVPVLLAGTADGFTGKVSPGGLEPNREYRLTLSAPGRPPVRTVFTTGATGSPVGLPGAVALAPLAALPSPPAAAPASGKKAVAALAAPAAGAEDIKSAIFHAFDVAGWYLKAPERADFDTDAFRFEWAKYAVNSCDPELAADLAAARDAINAVEKAFSDWQIDYEAGKDLRSDDFLKLTTAATQMAAQVTLLLTGIAGMEATLAATPNLSPAMEAFLGVLANTAQSLGVAINDLQSGQGLLDGWSSAVDHVTGIMGSFFTSFAGLKELSEGAAGNALAGMSNLFGFVDAMKAAYYDIDNLRNAIDDNLAKTLAQYLDDQQRYLDALTNYKRALDRLRHYSAPPGEACPDPPPATPPTIAGDPVGEPNIEGISSDDPNDITGPAGSGAAHYLAEDATLDYTIRFENKASASLPARTVTITHTLDDDADLSTFALGSAGFGDFLVTAPPRRQSWATTIEDEDTLVEVTARLSGRTVTWTFTALDPATGDAPADPLKGFLAPASGGFTTYSVKALAGERRLDATARVVFDANAPIDTNVYANAIDTTAPTSTLSAPTTTTSPTFGVSWSGADTGSGVKSYDVFVAVDGGAFTRWLTTAATSGSYAGAAGHRYAFYVVATDGVGHAQATPSAAAETRVLETVVVQPPPAVAPPATPTTPAVIHKPVLTIVHKGKGRYELRLRNAGNAADTFTLRAPKKAGFTILAGKKDVTKLVLKGSYRTAPVAPGKTLTLTIRAKRKGAWTLTATSTTSASSRSSATARYQR